ncbi:MAG: CHC2 zinc finger domain-containing protein [Prevotella sp.]|nr:CHC2 zinc finger domain-containing protein [Prevotella sp.]
MNKIDLDEIRATPIEEVAENLGIGIVRHMALCPFHNDKHPSLHFDLKKNRYKCFACGASGNVIDLVMRYNNMEFKEAINWIGNKEVNTAKDNAYEKKESREEAVDIEYLEVLMKNVCINEDAARFLFDERRIDSRVVEWCGLSSVSSDTPCWRWGKAFYDAPSLLIPYRDVDGKLLTVQGRYLGKEKKPRFKFPHGSQAGMYNKQVIATLKKGDELWITEGPSDCWAMMSAGRKAVAIPSATSLTTGDLRLLGDGLQKGVSLHMAPDNDRPGMELFKTLKRHFPDLQGHVLPDGVKDFGEMWKLKIEIG